jgi:L-seryl-tRNA(Ser) seleniumtransferase
VIDDLGSGALIPLSSFGITSEPLVADSVRAGTDVMCFSGDKLICGPQAGIICGKKKIIQQIRKNSYARMFRVCKMTLAALEATLLHFINDTYRTALPFYRMLLTPMETLELRARTLTGLIEDLQSLSAEIMDDVSYIGSGSLPDEGIPTRVVRIRLDKTLSGVGGIEELSIRLRMGIPSVFGRVKEDALFFDMRTLFEGEEQEIADSLRSALKDVHS